MPCPKEAAHKKRPPGLQQLQDRGLKLLLFGPKFLGSEGGGRCPNQVEVGTVSRSCGFMDEQLQVLPGNFLWVHVLIAMIMKTLLLRRGFYQLVLDRLRREQSCDSIALLDFPADLQQSLQRSGVQKSGDVFGVSSNADTTSASCS